MTTENVVKLGKIEKLTFSFVLLSYWPWSFEKTVNDDLADVSHHQKKKNQFELNRDKCIKMHMSGPKIHIELSVFSR